MDPPRFLLLEDEHDHRILIRVDSIRRVLGLASADGDAEVYLDDGLGDAPLKCTTSFDEVMRRLEVKDPG